MEKTLSVNWTYDFKKDRKQTFYDKPLNLKDFQGGQEGKNYVSLSFFKFFAQVSDSHFEIKSDY